MEEGEGAYEDQKGDQFLKLSATNFTINSLICGKATRNASLAGGTKMQELKSMRNAKLSHTLGEGADDEELPAKRRKGAETVVEVDARGTAVSLLCPSKRAQVADVMVKMYGKMLSAVFNFLLPDCLEETASRSSKKTGNFVKEKKGEDQMQSLESGGKRRCLQQISLHGSNMSHVVVPLQELLVAVTFAKDKQKDRVDPSETCRLAPCQESAALRALRDCCCLLTDLFEQAGREVPRQPFEPRAEVPLEEPPVPAEVKTEESKEPAEGPGEARREDREGEEPKVSKKEKKDKKDKKKDRKRDKRRQSEPGDRSPVKKEGKERKKHRAEEPPKEEVDEEEGEEEAEAEDEEERATGSVPDRGPRGPEELQERVGSWVTRNPGAFELATLPARSAASRDGAQPEAPDRSRRLPEPDHPPPGDHGRRGGDEEIPRRREDKKKKKKKQKKDKKEEKTKPKEKKPRAEEEISSSSESVKLDGSRAKVAAKKQPMSLFSGAGLDPREKVRRKVSKKARRALSRKGKKEDSRRSSKSSSSSVTSMAEEGDESVFQQSSKVRMVAIGYPGTLASQALAQMHSNLLSEIGAEERPGSLRACAVSYFRQQLARKATALPNGSC
eukprot:s4303_g1.t1